MRGLAARCALETVRATYALRAVTRCAYVGGMRLATYKANRKLKLSDLASLFGGMPISTVHGWVQGTRTPSLADAVRIETATGGAVTAKEMLPTPADAAA